jgi:hypothetical protein
MKGLGLDALGVKLDLGLNLELPKTAAAQNAADSDSALDVSQYTYYSEASQSVNQSVNQSGIHDGEGDLSRSMIESPDVRNIKADIEASDLEESKGEPLSYS